MVVATDSHPSHEVIEPAQAHTSHFVKQPCNVGHKSEWVQFFNIHPLTLFPCPHGSDEPLNARRPLAAGQRSYLGLPIAANDVREVSLPSGGHVICDIVHQISAMGASVAFYGSSGGGPVISSGAPRPSS